MSSIQMRHKRINAQTAGVYITHHLISRPTSKEFISITSQLFLVLNAPQMQDMDRTFSPGCDFLS